MDVAKLAPVVAGAVPVLAAAAGLPLSPLVSAGVAEAGATAALLPPRPRRLANDFRRELAEFRDVCTHEFAALEPADREAAEWGLVAALDQVDREPGVVTRQRLLGAARRGFGPFHSVMSDLMAKSTRRQDFGDGARAYVESLLTLAYRDVLRIALSGAEATLGEVEASRQFEHAMGTLLSSVLVQLSRLKLVPSATDVERMLNRTSDDLAMRLEALVRSLPPGQPRTSAIDVETALVSNLLTAQRTELLRWFTHRSFARSILHRSECDGEQLATFDSVHNVHQSVGVWVSARPNRPRRRGRGDSADRREEDDLLSPEKANTDSARQTWSEYFEANSLRNCVILGDPGYGKTWLLSYQALSEIESMRQRDADAMDGASWFPVFMTCRSLMSVAGGSLLARVAAYLQPLCRSAGAEPLSQITAHLELSGVHLFLDSFDEVDETSREEISRLLSQWQSAGLPGSVILSSRPVAYGLYQGMGGWTVAEIQPLAARQCTQMAHLWSLPKDTQYRIDAELSSATSIGLMLRVPLLLAATCQLMTDKSLTWPTRPTDVYELLINTLMEGPHRGDQAPRRLPPPMRRRMTTLLAVLAWQMAGGKTGSWQNTLSEEAVWIAAERLFGREGAEVAELIARSAVVSVPKRDLEDPAFVFEFPHRSVAEYLVARCLADLVQADNPSPVLDPGTRAHILSECQWQELLATRVWFDRDWDTALVMVGDVLSGQGLEDYLSWLLARDPDPFCRALTLATRVTERCAHVQVVNEVARRAVTEIRALRAERVARFVRTEVISQLRRGYGVSESLSLASLRESNTQAVRIMATVGVDGENSSGGIEALIRIAQCAATYEDRMLALSGLPDSVGRSVTGIDRVLVSALADPDRAICGHASRRLIPRFAAYQTADVVGLLAGPDPQVKLAAYELAGREDFEDTSVFLPLAHSDDPAIRKVAAWGLARGHGEDVSDALRRLSRDARREVRGAVAFVLGQFTDTWVVDTLLCLSTDKVARVKGAALRSLSSRTDESVTDELIAVALGSTGNRQVAAVRALGMRQGDNARAVIRELAHHPKWRVRAATAGGLAAQRDPVSESELMDLTFDRLWGVRLAVVHRLGAKTEEAWTSRLVELVDDSAKSVRRAALELLQYRPGDSVTQCLLSHLRQYPLASCRGLAWRDGPAITQALLGELSRGSMPAALALAERSDDAAESALMGAAASVLTQSVQFRLPFADEEPDASGEWERWRTYRYRQALCTALSRYPGNDVSTAIVNLARSVRRVPPSDMVGLVARRPCDALVRLFTEELDTRKTLAEFEDLVALGFETLWSLPNLPEDGSHLKADLRDAISRVWATTSQAGRQSREQAAVRVLHDAGLLADEDDPF